MYLFSEKSVKRMSGVHPELIFVFEESIKISPIDFGIPGDGGVRAAERQKELCLDGKSKCDGYVKVSRHQIKPGESYGSALDFYAYVDGSASWEKHHLSMVAAVIMATARRLKDEGRISIVLYWGGQFGSSRFDGWDFPHIEIGK